MTRAITCQSCGRAWTAAGAFSIYERQAVESCPCPDCGAYTLRCPEPDSHLPKRPLRPYRNRQTRAA